MAKDSDRDRLPDMSDDEIVGKLGSVVMWFAKFSSHIRQHDKRIRSLETAVKKATKAAADAKKEAKDANDAAKAAKKAATEARREARNANARLSQLENARRTQPGVG